MSQTQKPKIPTAAYPILAWMAINLVFLVLELTVLGDAADLNNSIELVLWAGSIAGLASMRKWGVAFAVFTLCYTMSTSMGNVIYYGLWEINGPRAILNLAASVYLFRSMFAGKFK